MMPRVWPIRYRVSWTTDAYDRLVALLSATGHAASYPDWVDRKLYECVSESIRRLEVFPDLRVRYVASGIKCGGMTLHTLPIQIFYRRVGPEDITVFDLRWASLDKTGPG